MELLTFGSPTIWHLPTELRGGRQESDPESTSSHAHHQDEPIQARLANVARRKEERRQLLKALEGSTPARNASNQAELGRDVEAPTNDQAGPPFDRRGSSMKSVMNDFVRLLEDNPKVWAVCADEDGSGIVHVWTYVDSSDRRDRSPVYRAEWQLLQRYPEVAFDFNVELLSPAEGQSEIEAASCVYKR